MRRPGHHMGPGPVPGYRVPGTGTSTGVAELVR